MSRAKEEKLSYWVAAELDPDYLHTHGEFVVGDNKYYHNYHNFGPLHQEYIFIYQTSHYPIHRSHCKEQTIFSSQRNKYY